MPHGDDGPLVADGQARREDAAVIHLVAERHAYDHLVGWCLVELDLQVICCLMRVWQWGRAQFVHHPQPILPGALKRGHALALIVLE
jgi:hypothetical protein